LADHHGGLTPSAEDVSMLFDNWAGILRVIAVGVTAFVLLVLLQYAIAKLSMRFKVVEHLVTVGRRAVLWDGATLRNDR
jgi:hypothetical protein